MKRLGILLITLVLVAITMKAATLANAQISAGHVRGSGGSGDPGIVDISQLPLGAQHAIQRQELWQPIGIGKSDLVQDPAWVAQKLAHQIAAPQALGSNAISSSSNGIQEHSTSPHASGFVGLRRSPYVVLNPTSNPLDSHITSGIVEPLGSNSDGSPATDDAGHSVYRR